MKRAYKPAWQCPTYFAVKEGGSYAIWSASPLTGDRKDLVAYARTKRTALRKIDKLYAKCL